MPKLIRILIILIFTLITCVFITWKIRPDLLRTGYCYARNLVTHCDDYQQKNYSTLLNDMLWNYVSVSGKSGIQPCRDEAELIARAKNGEVIQANGGSGYVIGKMHFSYPYLTREAVQLLEDIAIGFKTKISGTKLKNTSLIVTSMMRTIERNNALIEKNPIASDKSPHLNGNAFDISYIRYKSRRLYLSACDKEYLQSALSEVILELRKGNRCFATFERSQHCFHIVAR